MKVLCEAQQLRWDLERARGASGVPDGEERGDRVLQGRGLGLRALRFFPGRGKVDLRASKDASRNAKGTLGRSHFEL